MREIRMPLIFGVKSNTTVRRLKAAASYFEAISNSDDTHPDVTALAGKGVQSIGSIFATGGDNASDYDEDGNYTGANMHAYMADGDSGGSGKSAPSWRKTLANAVAEPLGHAMGILSHEHATDFDKRCALIAYKKLFSLFADDGESKGTNLLKAHLVAEFGLSAGAADDEVSKKAAELLVSGGLSHEKYMDLISPQEHHADMTAHDMNEKDKARMYPDSKVSPAQVYPGTGTVNVKKPSEMYSTKRYEAKNKRGEHVFRNGEQVTSPSDREIALTGVYFRRLALNSGIHGGVRPMNDHELELEKELINDVPFVGSLAEKSECFGRDGVKLFQALGRKGTDFVGNGSDGTTSGGTYLVPYTFDMDLVTYPLLSNELLPMVDLRELTTSNQVKTGTLANPPSVTWNGSEGSNALIGLETTDALASVITSNVFNMGLAVTIGRDLLSDTPLALGQEVTQSFGREFAYQTDLVIATGNGTTQPKGLTNTSGTNAASATNSTAGPFKVSDIEDMISSLPKQYRVKGDPSVAFVCSDACWWRIRGIPVSSTDQRRIFGYDWSAYTLGGYPVKIQNDIPGSDLFFGKLSLYRLWRRLGMSLEMTNDGKTLRLANQVLISGRTRLAGQFMNGAGLSFMSDAPLH